MVSRYALSALFSVALVGLSVTTAATKLGEHQNIKGAIQPSPSIVSGRSVLYFSVSKYALAEVGASLAYSIYNAEGEPVVFYDEETLATLPSAFQLWIFEHELEHFKLGHFDVQNTLYQKSAGFKGSQYSYEQAADCAAVKTLKDKYAMTLEDIELIAQTAQEVFHNSPLRRTSQPVATNYSHQFDYAKADERSDNIIACF